MTKLSDRFGVKVTSGNNALQWVSISASTTIENSYGYFVDTSIGAVTLTCPANPVLGDSFGIKAQDLTNTLTIDGNGNNIEGSTTLNVDVLGAGMTYVFSDDGWVNVTEIGGGESDMTVPEWSATYTYSIDDMVNYGGTLYKSLTDNNTNNQPDTSTSDWEEYASGGGGDTIPEWSSTYTYSTNDIINYNGTLYKSLVDDNTNHLPDETGSTYWEEYASSSSSSHVVENIGFTEIKTDRDFEESPGSWRPIYTKTIDVGAMPNNNEKHVAHNISDLSSVLRIVGECYNGTYYMSLPRPYTDSAYSIAVWVESADVVIQTASDRSSYEGTITLEYTKTTDTATSSPRYT